MALPSGQLLHVGRAGMLQQDIIGWRVCRVRGCASFPWHGRVVPDKTHDGKEKARGKRWQDIRFRKTATDIIANKS